MGMGDDDAEDGAVRESLEAAILGSSSPKALQYLQCLKDFDPVRLQSSLYKSLGQATIRPRKGTNLVGQPKIDHHSPLGSCQHSLAT